MNTTNIDSLKDSDIPTDKYANVLGYYVPGDGGGGDFYWDSSSTDTVNDGTIFQKNGETNGRWKRIINGHINVKWFGALGDGITNDKAAIEKAILIASTLKLNLFFPAGIYAVSSLVVSYSVYIYGDGFNTIIKSSGINNTHTITIQTAAAGTVIENLMVDGSGDLMPPPASGDGAQCLVTAADHTIVRDCKFINAYNKMTAIIGCKECLFENNLFDGEGKTASNQDGIQVYGGTENCNNNIIRGNQFINIIRAGVYLECDVTNTLVENNRFYNDILTQVSAAVIAQGFGDNLIFRENTGSGCRYGVWLRTGYGNAVVENNSMGIRSKFVSVFGSTILRSLPQEARFEIVKKTIAISGTEYEILCNSLIVKDNHIFWENLLETDHSLVQVATYSETFNGWVGPIAVEGNSSRTGAAISSIVSTTNYIANNSLNAITIGNNTFRGSAAYIVRDRQDKGFSSIRVRDSVFTSMAVLTTSSLDFDFLSKVTINNASGILEMGDKDAAYISNISASSITGFNSQHNRITIVANDGNTTIVNNATIKLKVNANKILNTYERISFTRDLYISGSIWFEV